MRLRVLLSLMVLGASACVAPHYATLRERAAAEGMCNDAPAQYLIGQKASAETGAAAMRATGAIYFNWIPPGSIVVAAFGPRLVRVTYDETYTITQVRCG